MSDYLDSTANRVSDGVTARGADVNNVIDAVSAGFDLLPSVANTKRGTINYGTDTGAADAYVVALPYVPSGYVDGLLVSFKAVNANTGASTINLNSLGVKSLRDQFGAALVAGDLPANKIVTARYNSTSGYMELQNVTAGNSANIATVAGIAANVTTVAGVSANVTTVAGISANVTTVAGISANVTAVAGVSTAVTTVAGISSDVTAVKNIAANVTTVAGVAASVPTVAGIAANVTTAAGVAAGITTVAGIASSVSTVAAANTAVSTVATNIASVNTAATNIAAIIAAPTAATNAATSASNAATSETNAASSAAAAATFAAGLSGRAAVRVATTVDLNATYVNGTGTLTNAGSLAALSIDGVSMASNDRVLVKNQGTTYQNGIYTVTVVGSGAVAWVLTRSVDFDSATNEVIKGAYTLTEEGSTQVGTLWIETGDGPFTIGVTPIVFTELKAVPQGATITGGKTLTVTDNVTLATNSITLAGGEVITFIPANALTLTTTGTTNATFPVGTTTLSSLGAETWTGDKTMAENVGIVLDAALSADGKYSGIVKAGTAGAALAFGELCYLQTSDSRWEKVKADATATSINKLGICVLAAAGDGSATTMLLFGNVRADSLYPTMTIGAPVFASAATAGMITSTAPSTATNVVRCIGQCDIDGDTLHFCPSPDYVVVQ